MDAKVYLKTVRHSVERMPILRQKKQTALDKATSAVAGSGDGPVVSSNISNIPEAYAIQVERYNRDIEDAERLIAEASRLIAKVIDPVSQDVLDLYYLQAEPWWAVADTIGRSYDYTCTDLHNAALKEFERVCSNPC